MTDYDWEDDAKGCYLEAIRHKRAEWLVENIPGVKRARIIGRCELLQGDCLEIMPHLDRVDAVVTDPPYGIFKSADSNGKMFGKETIYSLDKKAAGWDQRPSKDFLRSLMCAKAYIVWGGNYLADAMGASSGVLIWYKRTGNNSYADAELAWTNVTGTSRLFDHQWCGAFKDSERGQPSCLTPTASLILSWGQGRQAWLAPRRGGGSSASSWTPTTST